MVMSGRSVQLTTLFTRVSSNKQLSSTMCTLFSLLRLEYFNFSFYRPDRPEFSKIEKKIKVLFFNFIFRDRSDSPFFSSLHKFYQYQFSLCWFPSCKYRSLSQTEAR